MTSSRDAVLLIGGAGLPAWIWDRTRHELSHSTTVAARPTRATTARLADHVDAAVASAPPGRFAVVAHSSGAVIGTEVARRVPDRVSGLLVVSGVVPVPGGSFVSAMPVPNRWVLSAVMRLAGTRPPDRAIRRGLTAGLDAESAERLVEDVETESPGLFRDRTTARPVTVPRGYVTTSRDRELPQGLQRTFARRLGGSWEDDLATGHLPMLEDPASLAGSIGRFLDHLS